MAINRELSQFGRLVEITDGLHIGIGTTANVSIGFGTITAITITATTFVGDGSGLSGLSTFSGVYSDLTGTPTIPSNISELTNDSGYITTSFTSTSQLTNDAGFITNNVSGVVTATSFSGNLTGDVTGNANTASALETSRTISLSGDVSGSASFDGSANATITATVADDSHNHVISNVDGLQTALDAKAPLASPALTGTPTAPTAAAGTNTTQIATTAFVSTAVANVIDSAPGALDTLNELAAALGDDANFSTTVTNSIATKLPLSGGEMTGNITFSGSQTVDGRDLSVDGSKLDGIATGAEVNVQSDWNATSGDALILNKPTIPTNNNQLTNGAGYITGYTVTQSDVTSHQAALSITESQISDLGSYLTSSDLSLYATQSYVGLSTAGLASETYVDSATFSGDYNDLTNKPTIPTNNNQLTNGAGYITATLTDEQVQDIVGGMLTGNTESGITVTYQDTDGTIDFSVSSQTDNNFTTTLKNKLDGIESGATADQTASEILTAVKSVDGSGSGLDADLLDGQQGSYYQPASTALTTSTSFGGDVSGTYNAIVVADDSHNHIISNVDGLQTALDAKAPLASPALTGTPTAPTATAGTNSTQVATTAFVSTAVANVVDSAPAALDTLNELAAALGDDPNFATTVTTSIGTKLPLAGGQMTGNITFSGAQTVDGRDLSVDGSKLDGIESGATADQTASEILTAIKTVDGTGSGLDADLLDGQQGSYYLNTSTTFGGDVSGTYNAIVVADDSHNHIISNVDGLQAALDLKAPLASPALTGTPTAPTASSGTNTTQVATTAFVASAIAGEMSGNAATATTLETARTIGGVSFDGSANINLPGVNTAGNQDTSGNATTATTATNANNINVADESTDTTCNVVFTTGATGNLAPKTGSNLTFNSANGTLTATSFVGDGSNLTGITATADVVNDTTPQLGGNLDINGNDITGTGNINLTGNITVSGTVDGRDVATDGSKLDGIESGATADQTASEILTAIKTVDGSGSGLDADTVDGIQASSFLRSDASDTTTGNLTVNGIVITNELRNRTGQQLVLNAGESHGQATGQTGEFVYVNAESGLQINSTPDNWGSGWAGRNTVEICKADGTSTFPGDVTITGLLSATTKSFVIDHPTKEGMKLRYGSLEGPENGVYVRGRLKDNNTIELPDYWTGLVDEETITVNLTPIGTSASLHSVVDIIDNTVVVESANGSINCFYTVFGERKDVEKLEVEY